MTRLANHAPLTLLLAAAAALGLLALIAVLLPSLVFVDPPQATGDDPPIKTIATEDLELPPFAAYSAIAEKPLFNPGRRTDPAMQSAQTALAVRPLTDYRLVGIIVSSDARLALVRRSTSSEVVTLRPGDTLDGRHIDAVEDTGVVLSANGIRETLGIPRANGQPWVSAAPVAAGAVAGR